MIWNMFGEIITFFPLKKNSHTELPYIRVKKVYKICDLVDFSGIYSLAFIFGADTYIYYNIYIIWIPNYIKLNIQLYI